MGLSVGPHQEVHCPLKRSRLRRIHFLPGSDAKAIREHLIVGARLKLCFQQIGYVVAIVGGHETVFSDDSLPEVIRDQSELFKGGFEVIHNFLQKKLLLTLFPSPLVARHSSRLGRTRNGP